MSRNQNVDSPQPEDEPDLPPPRPHDPIEPDPPNPKPGLPRPDTEPRPTERPDLDWAEHED
jgi:hypothetical protein